MDLSSSDHLVNQTEMQTFQSSHSQPSLASSNLTCSLGREPLLFSPHPAQQTVSESFNDIPTYLFRLHAPQTAGETTTRAVISPAQLHGNGKRDIFRLPSDEAARCLSDHLWWRRNHEKCNLMSWSSSLLVVLQYGLYRYTTDSDKPSLSEIKLLVLDTRRFPKGTFIKDLTIIEAFHTLERDLSKMKSMREGKLYFGEYLTQGLLDITQECSQTSLQDLISLGLFTLCPGLGDRDHWGKWANRIVELRQHCGHTAKGTDKEEVRIAISIAQGCFGSRWALPIAAMLLSLQNRQNINAISDSFRFTFSGDEIASLDIDHIKFDPESGRLSELKMYRDLMMALSSQVNGTQSADAEIAQLGGLFGQLSVIPTTIDVMGDKSFYVSKELIAQMNDTTGKSKSQQVILLESIIANSERILESFRSREKTIIKMANMMETISQRHGVEDDELRDVIAAVKERFPKGLSTLEEAIAVVTSLLQRGRP